MDSENPDAAMPSPWEEVRTAHPAVILVRVIGPAVQFWIEIPLTAKNIGNGAELYDGATVLQQGVTGPSQEEIIAAADAAWHRQKEKPPSWATTS